MIEPLAAQLSGYFHFFGVKGGLLLQLGRHDEARVAFDRPSRWPTRRPRPRISAAISTASPATHARARTHA